MLIIGHRGARGLAPENTIASLEAGLKYKVDEIEVDLRVTKDQLVILNHNPFVLSPEGHKLLIAKTDYQVLKAAKPDLATLDEALAVIGKTPICLEIKPKVDLKPIIKLLDAHLETGWSSSQFRLASFSQKVLINMHAAFPDIQTIVNESWLSVRASLRAKRLGTRRISMNQKYLWKGFIKPVAKRGWLLSAYSINDPIKARRWASYGLYGVITDYPDRFK